MNSGCNGVPLLLATSYLRVDKMIEEVYLIQVAYDTAPAIVHALVLGYDDGSYRNTKHSKVDIIIIPIIL